jgi:hypothetical protein
LGTICPNQEGSNARTADSVIAVAAGERLITSDENSPFSSNACGVLPFGSISYGFVLLCQMIRIINAAATSANKAEPCGAWVNKEGKIHNQYLTLSMSSSKTF